jgi:nucleotide-binding universal stress UspA family protein
MNVKTARLPAATAIGGLRCILVAVPAETRFTETPALKSAVRLAAEHNAGLSLYVLPPLLRVPSAGTSGSASAWLKREQDRFGRQVSASAKAAGNVVSLAGVDFMVEYANSPLERRGERFVQLARTNDLSILDAGAVGDHAQRTLIEDVLFDSGRPVLLVPAIGSASSPRRIAIAWDGSARAARAAGDALPFLRSADTVVAVTIAGEKDLSRMAPGADLAAYLARHGVPDCKLANLAARRADVAARLRLFVNEEDLDMVVMGAFVHSRFREAVLGGVTRSLLDHTAIPLLMSH